MSDDVTNHPQIISNPSGILIPCPPEQFADFISNLLGKSQVAQGHFVGSFDISLSDIENFHHLVDLVDQRIREQNSATLVSFSVSIKYNDGTSVDLPSLEILTLEILRTYSEIRPIISTGVSLTWIYLVTFQSRSVPERQQIDVEIDTSNVYRPVVYKSNMMGVELEFQRTTGYAGYRISYTARTWGTDIENLLRDHIRSLVRLGDSKIKDAAYHYRNALQILFSLMIFIMLVSFGMNGIGYVVGKRVEHYQKYVSGVSDILTRLEWIESDRWNPANEP